jgi:hypothetical protein
MELLDNQKNKCILLQFTLCDGVSHMASGRSRLSQPIHPALQGGLQREVPQSYEEGPVVLE